MPRPETNSHMPIAAVAAYSPMVTTFIERRLALKSRGDSPVLDMANAAGVDAGLIRARWL
jgi:hypothetical protein